MAKKYNEEIKERARELFKQGNSYHLISKILNGPNVESIRRWCDPKVQEHYNILTKNNRQKLNEYNKEYHIRTRQERLEYHRERFQEAPEIKYNYIKKKCERDPGYKMRLRLSNRLNDALKVKDLRKASRTMNLVGCTTTDLKIYLESKFKPGMTWDNYGQWHIDHIKPCASFDLSKEEEQRKCFHYTNLQPLWAHENYNKGNRIITQ